MLQPPDLQDLYLVLLTKVDLPQTTAGLSLQLWHALSFNQSSVWTLISAVTLGLVSSGQRERRLMYKSMTVIRELVSQCVETAARHTFTESCRTIICNALLAGSGWPSREKAGAT